jgi:hypothetical protein
VQRGRKDDWLKQMYDEATKGILEHLVQVVADHTSGGYVSDDRISDDHNSDAVLYMISGSRSRPSSRKALTVASGSPNH